MRLILYPYLASSNTIQNCLRSSPLLQISVAEWWKLRARRGTNMSHLGPLGWGRLPSSRISIVSCMWWYKKLICRLVRIVSLPDIFPPVVESHPASLWVGGALVMGILWGWCPVLISPSHDVMGLAVYLKGPH